MNNKRNYNDYLIGMEKGNEEKLFFLDHLDLDNYDTIIDFGCGKGDILKACGLVCNAKLIGIDIDSYIRELAFKNIFPACPKHEIILTDTLTRDMLSPKTLIIFNSVLHEVEDYASELLDTLKGTKCTIVVRDMINPLYNPSSKEQISKYEFAQLVRYSHPQLLADFIERYGLKSRVDMLHYLLKYEYISNWELELNENYFSFNYNALFNLVDEEIYKRMYPLNYKIEKIREHFNIDISNDITHIQFIGKLA